MRLRKKQVEFSWCISELMLWARDEGYEIVTGDFARNSKVFGVWGDKKGYGGAKSNHKLCLAADLNLFVNDEYITSSEHPAWKILHDKWNTLSKYSAPMIKHDANHFSFKHRGRY